MTLFGWDASDYDWSRGPMDYAAAKAGGVTFATHKATEGTSVKHGHLAEALRRMKAAGIEFRGAYVVPRTPGNGGHGPIPSQAAYFLAYLDQAAPGWRTDPGFFLQVDTEKWSSGGVVYDAVSAANGAAMCAALAGTGKRIVHYAPHWCYGDAVPGGEALWSSNYEGNAVGALAAVYKGRGGDAGPGWAAYAGRVPTFWQFGSNLRIGGNRQCDGNAFRGDVAALRAFIRQATPTNGGMVMLCAKGDKGPVVEALQRLIMAAGGKLPKYGADADYGDETAAGLKAVIGGDGNTYGPAQYVALMAKAFAGKPGTNGRDGTNGKDGTNGRDGRDGVGVGSRVLVAGEVTSVVGPVTATG